MYSPGSPNVAVVAPLPRNGSSGLPPVRISTSGLSLAKVTVPGPRYVDHRTSTGGRGFNIGALDPLEYFASSSVQKASGSGVATRVVRVRAGRLTIATGP